MRNLKTMGLVLAILIILVLFIVYGRTVIPFLPPIFTVEVEPAAIIQAALVAAGVYITYVILSYMISSAIIRAGGKRGDVKMLTNFLRSIIFFIGILLITSIFTGGGLTFATALGAFGGMFLGWSLQQPVTGLAAWFLINIRRPFKVGDRIFLPAWGLIGDVLDVGMMYTTLNQVGGTIGSEEPSGRRILIPNAILFSNVIINYTSEIKTTQPYILDEVVVRITYDSDWEEAERIMKRVATEVTQDIIKETGVEPYVRSDFYDYGVYLRLRYMTLAVDRPRIAHEINRRIFEEFQENEKVDFAIPFIYSYKKGEKAFRTLGDSEAPS
ncbi:MAG: mechanosensitive ion channel family protein [Candidatus Brockarchaeota archaeon]|nr:mechanosensitive ion channel family protein [Candidatus Brockarchaeota archaeon]